MAGEFTDLRLFGFDLSRIAINARLAWEQFAFGPESGLYSAFYPRATLVSPEGQPLSPPDVPMGDHHDQNFAVLLPDESVLLKTEELPDSAELYLEQAVTNTALINSPFEAEDTRWGWRVISRSGGQLHLEIAITSIQVIENVLGGALIEQKADPSNAEVWVNGETGYITLPGFGERNRRTQYLTLLRDMTVRYALTALMIIVLLSLPSVWVTIKADQLEALLERTQISAREVTLIREDLAEETARLDQAKVFFSDRLYYQDWLNALSDITPDNAYLFRLAIKEKQLTISGFAENAADYQGTLANSGYFSELSAPSAFKFDERANRERFSLTMVLESREQAP